MAQAREKGFLGKNIFDSGFDFDIRIKAGAGAFVCGEETALIASLEGERGMPRLKPPFPAAKGYWQKPTDIFTNHPDPQFRPPCRRGDKCHDAAPRGSKTGTQGLRGKLERAKLPDELCRHVVRICESLVSL